jgi:hypothetical protein
MDSHSIHPRARRVILVATTALVLAATTATAPAEAADRGQRAGNRSAQTHAQKQRPTGNYTRHTEVQRTENGHTRTDAWTGERGTTTRQAEVVNDRANQTRTRNVQWTGPQGQQRTRTDVTQRTESGYTRQSTSTGPQGGATSRNVVATRDAANGTWTRDVTVEHTPPPSGNGN